MRAKHDLNNMLNQLQAVPGKGRTTFRVDDDTIGDNSDARRPQFTAGQFTNDEFNMQIIKHNFRA